MIKDVAIFGLLGALGGAPGVVATVTTRSEGVAIGGLPLILLGLLLGALAAGYATGSRRLNPEGTTESRDDILVIAGYVTALFVALPLACAGIILKNPWFAYGMVFNTPMAYGMFLGGGELGRFLFDLRRSKTK